MTSMVRLLVALCLARGTAMAEHHHHGMVTGQAEKGSSFAAGLSLVAAEYDTMEYGGEYQGLVPNVRWSHGRFGVAANVGVYRLEKNGLELHEATDAQLLSVSPALTPEVREVLTVEGSVASRTGAGGTAPVRVGEQRAELVARVQAAAHALGL